MFQPTFTITHKMKIHLQEIHRASVVVDQLPLPEKILKQLQKDAKETTVLLSTKIEGNNLNEGQKRKALYKSSEDKRELEIYNLMKAIKFLDKSEKIGLSITEQWIKELHAIIQKPNRGLPQHSEYRTEQIQVGRRNQAGFYLPPEYSEVSGLMEDLVAWLNSPKAKELVDPITAGIAMWQFLTIHPFIDGNGRTARLIATYLLHRGQFGLKRLFVLEKYYDRTISEYYEALQMGYSHNYYFGRHNADITRWLEYFLTGLAEVYSQAAHIVQEKYAELLRRI